MILNKASVHAFLDEEEIIYSQPLKKIMGTAAFKRACQHGMTPYRYGRIMVTGKYGDGKTSLIQALLGKPIPETHEPTNGLDAHYSCKVDITKCTEGWSELLIEKKNIVDDRITMGIIRHAERKQTPEDVTTTKEPDKHVAASHDELDKDKTKKGHITEADLSLEPSEFIKEDDKQLYEKVNKKKDDYSMEKTEDKAVIFIWDFGGQKVYTNLHPIFLRSACVHIVVYDLEKLEKASNKEEWESYSDEIEFWLQMIQSNYKRPTNTNQVPNVLLVGTHKDKLQGQNAVEKEKCAEQLIECLRKKLTGKQYKYLISDYFHVDSKGGVHRDTESFKKLKKCLIASIKVCPTWEIERPIPYMRLLSKLYEQEEKPEHAIMKYEDIMKYASEYDIKLEDDVKQFLAFHHTTGDLTYFSDREMESYVIVNAQWLVNVFTKVITIEEYYSINNVANQKELDKLKMDGLILKRGSLLADLWKGSLHGADDEKDSQKNYLTRLMCRFDLMIEHGERNYVIPCLLKEPADLEQLETKSPTIYLQFHATQESHEEFLDSETPLDYFLPPALFHQLVCRLATTRSLRWKRDHSLSQRNRFIFKKGSQKIILASKSIWIRLSLSDKKNAAEILGKLQAQLDQLLKNCYCNMWYEFCVNPCQGTEEGTLECITSIFIQKFLQHSRLY